MDRQNNPGVLRNRQPLGDATWRVNHAAAARPSGSQRPARYHQISPPGKPKGNVNRHANKQDQGRSEHSPGQSENYPPSPAEPVHTDHYRSTRINDPIFVAPISDDGVPQSPDVSITDTSSSSQEEKTHIGPWRLGRALGAGASAQVRYAQHEDTHQPAAVKIIAKKTAHLTQAGSLANLDKVESGRQAAVNRAGHIPLTIEREVAIMKLIEHPNIVKIYDIWESGSEIYLILEFVEKGDLYTFINCWGPLREEHAVHLFRQMMSAIHYCHSLNICHRDLKPENILLDDNGQIKIADFGMAALHQGPGYRLRTACGSPHYAAPELLKQYPYKGEIADIWSMGVILFAMLVGSLPFNDPNIHDMLEKSRNADYEMPDFLSNEAQDLIRRILQVEPSHRISMAQMWKHPLIEKYRFLDNSIANSGQAPDVRRGIRLAPVKEEQIDGQILRQLRSVWHAVSEQDLKVKLTSERPNDEKLFYRLLYNYRENQMENYNPGLGHSPGDFHHLRPANLGKRVSTCRFTQLSRAGTMKSVSRFTVISNVAETEAGTVQSYDPYNSSRVLSPSNSQVSHAKVTIHRNNARHSSMRAQVESSVVSRSYHSYKSLSMSPQEQRKRMSLQPAGSPAAQILSPPQTMTSIRSSRVSSNPRIRPNLRHKRGVVFSGVRKFSIQTPPPKNNLPNRMDAASIAGDNTTYGRDIFSSSSPYKKSRRAGETGAQARDGVIWNDELKQLGNKIAEHCDEAFRSSIVTSPSPASSDRQRKVSPLSLTLDTTTTSSERAKPAAASSRQPTLQHRPLPPIPVKHGAPRRSKLTKYYSNGDNNRTYGGSVPSRKRQQPDRRSDRRMVSEPVHSRYSKEAGQLPSIYEATLNSWMQQGTGRGETTSTSTDSPAPLPTPHDNRGLEYLSKIDKSIRVVVSPTGPQRVFSPVEAPAPLNLRKKVPRDVVPEAPVSNGRESRLEVRGSQDGRVSRLEVHEPLAMNGPHEGQRNESRTSSQGSVALSGLKKKTSSWFRRSSKESAKENADNAKEGVNGAGHATDKLAERKGAIGPTTNGSRSTSQSTTDETATAVVEPKKKFNFSFWKTNKKEAKMYLADPTEVNALSQHHRRKPKGKASRPGASPQSSSGSWVDDESSGRKIDLKQNWLARLFRVKPHTRYLCFTVSRRRARQEITALLKEWQKYGIADIEVSKEQDTVFARLDSDNYLHLKEVTFAAEAMMVIEHGKRNHLSIVRFTQESGAASSLNKVVDTMNMVFGRRNIMVTDSRKIKMMIKTLNSGVRSE